MMHIRFRRGTRAAAWGLAAALLVMLLWPSIAGAAGSDDVCKKALSRCFTDMGLSFDWLNPVSLFLNAEFCLVGYDFCKKFVAQLL